MRSGCAALVESLAVLTVSVLLCLEVSVTGDGNKDGRLGLGEATAFDAVLSEAPSPGNADVCLRNDRRNAPGNAGAPSPLLT